MAPHQIEALLALGLGFAFAGLITSLYSAWRETPPSFHLLLAGGAPALAAVPLLAAAGPAIIMRNTLRGRRYERRKVHFVAIATFIASLWSMVMGQQLLKLLTLVQ
jgi:hypothetical protein